MFSNSQKQRWGCQPVVCQSMAADGAQHAKLHFQARSHAMPDAHLLTLRHTLRPFVALHRMPNGRWRAQFTHRNKVIQIGMFDSEEEVRGVPVDWMHSTECRSFWQCRLWVAGMRSWFAAPTQGRLRSSPISLLIELQPLSYGLAGTQLHSWACTLLPLYAMHVLIKSRLPSTPPSCRRRALGTNRPSSTGVSVARGRMEAALPAPCSHRRGRPHHPNGPAPQCKLSPERLTARPPQRSLAVLPACPPSPVHSVLSACPVRLRRPGHQDQHAGRPGHHG